MQIGDVLNQKTFNVTLAGKAKEDFGKGYTQVKASCMAVQPSTGSLVLLDTIITKLDRASSCTNDVMHFDQVAVATFPVGTWLCCAPVEGEEVNL